MSLSFEAEAKSSASAPASPYFRLTNAVTRSISERFSRKKVSQFISPARIRVCGWSGDSRRIAIFARPRISRGGAETRSRNALAHIPATPRLRVKTVFLTDLLFDHGVTVRERYRLQISVAAQ